MKAFLSHSSKDKHFVRAIADKLGPALCEYDEYTFEFILNAQAIRQAFARADLFVLFLSQNSIRSNFVAEEIRTALDLRASGQIKKVLLFSLDATSYKALPEWMQAINVSARLTTPMTCARRIETELYVIGTEASKSPDFYQPRDEETPLRAALSKPPGIAPIAIHIVGHAGIGRRTFLQTTLRAVFPRQIQTVVYVPLNRFEGVNEFYRRLYEYFVVASVDEAASDFEKFAQMTEVEQVKILADILTKVVNDGEFIIVEDWGGAYQDDGSYQSFLESVIKKLKGANRPVIAFSQTRMMPLTLRDKLPESYHTFLTPLDDAKITQFLSFSLRDAGIDFSAEQLADLKGLVDGVPLNVKFAVKAVSTYGLSQFLADPSVLLEWKQRRGEDFLSRLQFPELEAKVISLLLEFRYLEFDFIRDNVTASPTQLGEALRRLEEFCCIERRGAVTFIHAAVQEAAARDKRFKRNNKWRGEIALKVLELVESYKGDENAPITLLESAAKATIISGKFSGIATQFILPSHFLMLAHDAYIDDRRKDSLDFCKKAYALRTRLSVDGAIEILRLWGLSAIRLGDQDELDFALKELETYRAQRVAKRNLHFLRGFQLGLKKDYDKAEQQFLKAHKFAPRNLSINRELASLYRHRREYVEAEVYARAGYEKGPANPFVIDVLLESLLGKASHDMKVDHEEIARLFIELKRYGDVPGSSFYQARKAQDLFRQKKKPEALAAADTAILRTPEFLPVYYLRADIRLSLNDTKGARDDLKKINDILDRRGGLSEDDEGKTTELEIKILIEEKQYRPAKDRVMQALFLPGSVRRRLRISLARAISFEQAGVDSTTRTWALDIIKAS